MKDVRSQGGCPAAADKGDSSDADVRSTFRCNKIGFFVIYCVSARRRGGGFSQCGHVSDKWEEVNFSRFCADVFYGRPSSII